MYLPRKEYLKQTSDVDYYNWNFKFPIKYIQRFRFKAILKMMGNERYNKLLEIGTGSGIFLPELSKHCNELYACDIHNNMDAVKTLCAKYSIDAELEHCPMENLKFPGDFFDVIISISVLEFVNNLEKSIEEVKRVLKPSGIFLTICFQKSYILDFVLNLYSRKQNEEEFIQSRKKISLMIEKNFNVLGKNIFPSVVGRIIPVYYYYKLTK